MAVVTVLGSSWRAVTHNARADGHQHLPTEFEISSALAGQRLPREHTSSVSLRTNRHALTAVHQLVEPVEAAGSAKRQFEAIVRRPAGPPTIALAAADPQGRTGQAACSTCHAVRPPNLDNRTAASLDEFHQGLPFSHGQLACYACHDPAGTDSLRLADGSRIAYQEVMTLCGQCHGPQATAFAQGAHGGMNGFWDLSRGPQYKNNCIDCHDPHSPSFPQMIVGFKAKDRFNHQPSEH